VAEEGKDHFGPGIRGFKTIVAHAMRGHQLIRLRDGRRAGKPLVRGAEVHRAEPVVWIRLCGETSHLVAGEAEVAEYQVVLGKSAVKVGLQPAVVLHALGERVADDTDMVAGPDLELVFRFRLVATETCGTCQNDGKTAHKDGQ